MQQMVRTAMIFRRCAAFLELGQQRAGLHIFKLGIGELLWRWTLASTIPFQPYEPLTACFGEV